MRYNLGAGQEKAEGFIDVDLYAPDATLKVDLFKFPWPIESASVDFYYSSHFVEHVPDWDAHFAEVYRTLRPNGVYELIAPYYMSRRFFQDPDHKQPVSQERFLYLDPGWLKRNHIDHGRPKMSFEIIGWFERLHEDFLGMAGPELHWHKLHSFNVIEDVACVLRKRPLED